MKGMVEGMEYRLLRLETRGNIVVATILTPDLLDATSIKSFGEELFSLLNVSSKIVLDFTQLTVWNSVAFGKIITMDTKVRKLCGSWTLCGISPILYEPFEFTQSHKMFSFVATREEALLQLA